MLYLALGTELSEFRCLPDEMLARLDQHPDAAQQVREIFQHYNRLARRRENVRILDLERRALSGKDEQAQTELAHLLDTRAEVAGTTPEEELARVKRITRE